MVPQTPMTSLSNESIDIIGFDAKDEVIIEWLIVNKKEKMSESFSLSKTTVSVSSIVL
jgi:hypothetical protein